MPWNPYTKQFQIDITTLQPFPNLSQTRTPIATWLQIGSGAFLFHELGAVVVVRDDVDDGPVAAERRIKKGVRIGW